jgi:Tol biopolymer transport system component
MSHVVFSTTERLTSDDTDIAADLFDRTANGLRRISTGSAGGNGNFPVTAVDLRHVSAGGDRVTFVSPESLTTDDVDGFVDLFQRSGETTTRISTGPLGGNGAGSVGSVLASADGRAVAFETNESLTPGDVSGIDVYLRVGNQTTLLTPGAGLHTLRGISTDGSRVFVESTAKLAGTDSDDSFDVYQWTSSATTQLTGGSANIPVGFVGASADGTRVFFATTEQLATDTDNQSDVYEASGGTITRVSTGSGGGNGASPAFFAGASADGTRVFFHTDEPLEGIDADASQDVFERRGGNATFRVSAGTAVLPATYRGSSKDGTRVFFSTIEALEGGATPDGADDVFAVDNQGQNVVSTGPNGGDGAQPATFLGNSGNGARAFFTTTESLTADDTDASIDVYERTGNTTTRVSTGPAGGNAAVDAFGLQTGISADGSRVVFTTSEVLTPNDEDLTGDLYERSGATTRLLSGEGIPPNTTITGGPANGQTIATATPTFTFASSEPGSSFECSLDSAAFQSCGSPGTTPPLTNGAHQFRVRARDAAGNLDVSPEARAFTVQVGGAAARLELSIISRRLRLDRRRRVAVVLRCVGARSARCQGTLRIRTRKRVRTSRGRRVVTLARGRYNLAAGSRRTVRLRLSRTNARLVRRLRRVPVVVTATISGRRAVSKRLTLRR